jgi:hypothetical protein
MKVCSNLKISLKRQINRWGSPAHEPTQPPLFRHEQSGAAGIGLRTTINYRLRTTSGAAGNGLGNTVKSATHNERRRGQRPSATIKYLRRTTSGAAGNGLSTTIKYLRGAAGIGLGSATKFLRDAVHIGLGTTAK